MKVVGKQLNTEQIVFDSGGMICMTATGAGLVVSK